MANIVKCCGTFHNMCVEEQESKEGPSFVSEEQAVEVTLGENAVPMWRTLDSANETMDQSWRSLAAL